MSIIIFIKQQADRCNYILRKIIYGNNKKSTKSPYIPLSPTDNAEDCSVYLDALPGR